MKIGKKVTVTRRNGVQEAGKIVDIKIGGRGAWYHVNVAEPRQEPVIVAARAANLQAA